ncbi:MAG: sugar transferase [Bacteroidota bacterium]
MKQVLLDHHRTKPAFVLYLEGEQEMQQLSAKNSLSKADLKVFKIHHPQQVKKWLHNQLFQGNGNFVVLCDYEELERSDFKFVKEIQQEESLRYVPIFVHIEPGTAINKEKLIRLGVDDCLETPLDWENVERKADFWLRYKSQIKYCESPEAQERLLTAGFLPTFKRLFDVTMATALLIVLSPLLLLLAVLIKLDSRGPIFYKSKRIGSNYRTFDFWKFRSMYQDADDRLETLLHLNQYECNTPANCFIKLKNDPRITRIGRIIRKTSLDELPQLFNVLRGEMSLVGNRPLPPYEAVMMVDDYRANRFLAPAGLTGLWQVSKRGKSDMSTDERVDLDVEYAQSCSFWYDMRLLLRTFPAMIQEEDV